MEPVNIFAGPVPQARAARQAIVDRILADLQRTYADQIIAVGLYGSMARASDLPYSDVEIYCVLMGEEIDLVHEWVYGPSKAEVNIMSADVFRHDVLELDESWSVWKGSYLDSQPLYGDAAFFEEMRALVMSPAPAAFNAVVAGIIVGELYEWMGKLHNARQTGNHVVLPQLACQFAESVALILGLVHRHCYTTGATMMAESLHLASRPAGYDELCALVMTGTLSDPALVTARLVALWQGLGPWSVANEITLDKHIGWPF